MPFVGHGLYRCECGNTFELDPGATRCSCKCHDETLKKAKERGQCCEKCGFSTLSQIAYKQHFNWSTHQKAVKEKQLRG